MAANDLPQYTPKSLAIPLLGLADIPSGVYVESSKEFSVKLHDQHPRDTKALISPTFGRGSPIRGEIEILRKPEKVEQVEIKLEGFVRLDTYDGFPSKKELVSLVKLLHSHPKDKTAATSKCPSKLEFSFTFPTEEEIEKSLPSTFETPQKQTSKLYSRVYYRLVAVVEAKRMFGMGGSSKNLTIDVNYYPRTSPPAHNIASYENFDPSEDWHKTTKEIRVKSGAPSDVLPLTCTFYIPASGTFGINDTIPFHVQITGTSPAMDEFLPPSYPQSNETVSSSSPSTVKKAFNPVKMKVTFMRKITVKPQSGNPDAEEISSEAIVGEANVVPLLSSNSSNDNKGDKMMVVTEWGGEIQCKEEAIKTGTFSLEGLTIMDNLMLAINPHHPHLITTKLAVPIRLVTDAWVDGSKNVAQMHGLKEKAVGAALYGFAWGSF